MTHTSRQSGSHNRRGSTRACGCCLLAPIVVGLCLFATYKIANRIPQIIVPTHGVPADNALAYFHRAYQLSRSMQHITPYDMPGRPAQDYTLVNFRGCAADAEPALKILREGLNHSCVNPAVRTVQSVSPQIYAELRDLARIDAGAAEYYALSGDPGRSIQMRLDGLEMAVMVPRGGGLIAGLVGLACESIAESGIEPLISKLSSKELAGAAERLERTAAKRVPYSDTVQEDGYVNAALALDELRHPSRSPIGTALSQLGIGQDSGIPVRERVSDSMQTLQGIFVNKGAVIQQDLDVYTALAKAARGPYTNRATAGIPNSSNAADIVSAFNMVRAKFVADEAALTVLQLETALYRCRKDHGRFPLKLAQLSPVYFRFVPLDPCNPSRGATLRYTAKNGGADFLLYSVGPDMIDGGGVPGRRIEDQPGDIVAGKLDGNRRNVSLNVPTIH